VTVIYEASLSGENRDSGNPSEFGIPDFRDCLFLGTVCRGGNGIRFGLKSTGDDHVRYRHHPGYPHLHRHFLGLLLGMLAIAAAAAF